MNHMYEILARFGWAWTPIAFAVWGVSVVRRRRVVSAKTVGTEAELAHEHQ